VLAENNAHLTSALLEYEKQFFDYEQIKSENAYLREILPVIKEQNLDTLTVIHHLKTPFITLVYTSPNVSNRIKIGHIVISPQGMVGYITSKRQKQGYCEVLVLLPTHIQSRIPVIGERNQSTAILCGQNSSIMSIQYPLGDQKSAEDSFVECPAKKFDDGELLFLLGTKIPVAKVAPQRDKAIWVVKPTGRVTIVISENMLGDVSDSDLASDLTNK
jgi:hypothetical protein